MLDFAFQQFKNYDLKIKDGDRALVKYNNEYYTIWKKEPVLLRNTKPELSSFPSHSLRNIYRGSLSHRKQQCIRFYRIVDILQGNITPHFQTFSSNSSTMDWALGNKPSSRMAATPRILGKGIDCCQVCIFMVFLMMENIIDLLDNCINLNMLLTKLHIPQPKENVIHRYILFDKLNFIPSRKLILVSAPAGYGKTTLLCDWLKKSKMPTAWFSIDHRDNDVFEFVSIVINGIQSIHKDIGNQSLELLKSNVKLNIEYIIELLINDMLTVKSDFLLVLDDLHSISSKEIYSILNSLITQSPDNFKIAILTRSDPPINLSRLRSQNELIEIRSSDLSFTTSDISELFNKNLKLGLNNEDIHVIKAKTEGWIAGLQLAGLSLKGREDVSAFIEKLKGDNRYIMDYLIEEVLQQQSSEIRDFLLCTSILDRFNASLCNFTLNINNSQEIIERLEWNNMFIIPLDDERNWFRYHHLFKSLLQKKLAVQINGQLADLHYKACQWFEKNKLTIPAIEHAINAGNKQKALSLITGIIDRLWGTAQYGLILKFGEIFSEEEMVTHENFCIIYSWVLFESGNIEKAEDLLLKLLDQTTDKNQKGKIYVCLSNLKAFTGNIGTAFKYSELATQNISEKDILWNIWANISHGESHLLRLELNESLQSYEKAIIKASEANIIYLKLVCQARACFILWNLGEYSNAYNKCKNLLETCIADTSDGAVSISFATSLLYSIVGNYQIERNEIEEGLKNTKKGYELSQKTTNEAFKASCTHVLAQAYYKLGEYNKAIEVLEDLDNLLYKQTMQLIGISSDSLKSKLYILMDKKDKLKSFFEKKITPDKNHAFETFMFNINKARLIIAQGNFDEAIELLQNISIELEQEKAYGLLTEVELLKAKAYVLIQEQEKAVKYLSKAIHRTQYFGLIRTYINEGEDIAGLLKEISNKKLTKSSNKLGQISNQYLHKLNTAFEIERNRKNKPSESDLSSRELEILKLISQKLSNNEICEKLYISLSTVKTHVSNILLKLEAGNRIEATEIAKQKGLL